MEPIAGKTEKWGKHLYFHHTVKIKQYDRAFLINHIRQAHFLAHTKAAAPSHSPPTRQPSFPSLPPGPYLQHNRRRTPDTQKHSGYTLYITILKIILALSIMCQNVAK